MKCLIVEDDFVCRTILQKHLQAFGDVHVAVDGKEALVAIEAALAERAPYGLVCLDIMMPGMDGHEVLQRIRGLEKERGILGLEAVKVLMTTALSDPKNVVRAFHGQCEGYLVKPIDKARLLEKLRELAVLPAATPDPCSATRSP